MEMEKKGFFSFKTMEGSRRLLALFIVLILLFSLCARVVSTDGATIKVERVTIDSRGAAINGDLYYPVGTSDKDSLPAVLVGHGGGVASGVIKGIAEEIARRGFVVLNVDAYGAGLSEQPLYDDGGQGVDGFSVMATPSGMIDSINFLRSLNFVDKDRIGIAGHSLGSRRAGFAAIMDCGYLTFNDIMINTLYDTFELSFTEEEINQDADTLAAERLNADQMVYYNALKEQKREEYDAMIKTICLIGSDANLVSPIQPVEVAGYEVMRNCQVNMGIISGTFDFGYRDYNTRDTTKEAWHTGSEDVVLETWYALDDASGTSEILGGFWDVSSADNADLQEAIQNRTLRIVMQNRETHSQNFFSKDTTTDAVKYLEQTLSYNNGELSDAGSTALEASNIKFFWRETFNLLAMLSMIGLIAAFASLLLKTKYFMPCVSEKKSTGESKINKKSYWLFAAITVVLTFIAMYISNTLTPFMFPVTKALPLFGSFWITVALIAILSAGSVILLIVYSVMNKKKNGDTGLKVLNIKMKFKNFLKTLLLSVILLAFAYLALVLIEYLFNQDFRFWMASFGEMKVEYWELVWRYTLLTLPFFLIIGAGTNYTTRDDIPEWRDTLNTVVIGSLGIWLCCFINQFLTYSGILPDSLFSSFISTYGMLIVVPITVYVTRKMYKLTNSIWLGALVNSLLISWTLISAAGLSCDVFFGQTFLSVFFG